MQIFEKGTQVHATEVFFVKSGALYVDEAKTVAANKEDAVKAIKSGRVIVNDGTNLVVPTLVKLDGTKITANEVDYTLS